MDEEENALPRPKLPDNYEPSTVSPEHKSSVPPAAEYIPPRQDPNRVKVAGLAGQWVLSKSLPNIAPAGGNGMKYKEETGPQLSMPRRDSEQDISSRTSAEGRQFGNAIFLAGVRCVQVFPSFGTGIQLKPRVRVPHSISVPEQIGVTLQAFENKAFQMDDENLPQSYTDKEQRDDEDNGNVKLGVPYSPPPDYSAAVGTSYYPEQTYWDRDREKNDKGKVPSKTQPEENTNWDNDRARNDRRKGVPEAVEMVHFSGEDREDIDNGNAPELEISFGPSASRYFKESERCVGLEGTYQPKREDVEQQPDQITYSRREIATNQSANTDAESAQGYCPQCDSCGPFNAICTMCQERVPRKWFIIIVILVSVILGSALFLGIFASSFIYIEYYQMALLRTKSTGGIEYYTKYPGCYVLGPDKEFRYFNSTGYHMVFERLSVYTRDRLVIEFDCKMQLFLKPEELSALYGKFELNFTEPFRTIIKSTIKNAVTGFSLDEFRFNRTMIENTLHDILKIRLGGNCCPDCCISATNDCNDRWLCSQCRPYGSCELAYHTDVRYFHMGAVYIEPEITSRFLARTVISVQGETEDFLQEYAVQVKENEKNVQQIKNEAAIVRSNGTHYGDLRRAYANAEFEVMTRTAELTGLLQMCSYLNISQEDHKLSLYMIHTLEKLPELYRIPDFEKVSRYRP